MVRERDKQIIIEKDREYPLLTSLWMLILPALACWVIVFVIIYIILTIIKWVI